MNPPSTIPNPIPEDFLNPIAANLAMIPNPIPVIFPSATPNSNLIPISNRLFKISKSSDCMVFF